jgi:hypothetical protein
LRGWAARPVTPVARRAAQEGGSDDVVVQTGARQ